MVGAGASDGVFSGVVVFVLSSEEILLSEDRSGAPVGDGAADGVEVISVLSAGSAGFPHETVETASSPAQASALIRRGNFLLCTVSKVVDGMFFFIDKINSFRVLRAVSFFRRGKMPCKFEFPFNFHSPFLISDCPATKKYCNFVYKIFLLFL